MPRVRCISLPGVELIFYSNDHDPPHLHAVKRDHWHYRVFFLRPEGQALENKAGPRSISGNVRRQLLGLVDRHRFELLQEWESTRADD